MRIIKEHQKINQFFSKQEEERDGILLAASITATIHGKKLPLVAVKSLRHQKAPQGLGGVGGVSKLANKPPSYISRHYQAKKDLASLQGSNLLFNDVRMNQHGGQQQHNESNKKLASMLTAH